jgi:hypothetical protein
VTSIFSKIEKIEIAVLTKNCHGWQFFFVKILSNANNC